VTSASALTNAQGAPHTEQALGITARAGAASPLDRESICLIEIERCAISIVTRRVRLIIKEEVWTEHALVFALKMKAGHDRVGSISETHCCVATFGTACVWRLQGTLKKGSIRHQIAPALEKFGFCRPTM
jgi:hypothetical protein